MGFYDCTALLYQQTTLQGQTKFKDEGERSSCSSVQLNVGNFKLRLNMHLCA